MGRSQWAQRPAPPGPSRSLADALTLAREREKARVREKDHWVKPLQAVLQELAGYCAMCSSVSDLQVDHESLVKCPKLSAHQDFSRGFRKQLNYNPTYHYHICYWCHVPRGPKEVLHPPSEGLEGCRYRDILVAFGFRVMTEPGMLQAAGKHFGRRLSGSQDFITWLNGAPCGGYPSHLVAVCIWYVEQCWRVTG